MPGTNGGKDATSNPMRNSGEGISRQPERRSKLHETRSPSDHPLQLSRERGVQGHRGTDLPEQRRPVGSDAARPALQAVRDRLSSQRALPNEPRVPMYH